MTINRAGLESFPDLDVSDIGLDSWDVSIIGESNYQNGMSGCEYKFFKSDPNVNWAARNGEDWTDPTAGNWVCTLYLNIFGTGAFGWGFDTEAPVGEAIESGALDRSFNPDGFLRFSLEAIEPSRTHRMSFCGTRRSTAYSNRAFVSGRFLTPPNQYYVRVIDRSSLIPSLTITKTQAEFIERFLLGKLTDDNTDYAVHSAWYDGPSQWANVTRTDIRLVNHEQSGSFSANSLVYTGAVRPDDSPGSGDTNQNLDDLIDKIQTDYASVSLFYSFYRRWKERGGRP